MYIYDRLGVTRATREPWTAPGKFGGLEHTPRSFCRHLYTTSVVFPPVNFSFKLRVPKLVKIRRAFSIPNPDARIQAVLRSTQSEFVESKPEVKATRVTHIPRQTNRPVYYVEPQVKGILRRQADGFIVDIEPFTDGYGYTPRGERCLPPPIMSGSTSRLPFGSGSRYTSFEPSGIRRACRTAVCELLVVPAFPQF